MGGTHHAGTDGFCRSLHLGLVSSLLKPLSPSPLPLLPRRLRHPPTATTTAPELFILSSSHPRSVSEQIHSLISSHPISPGPCPALSPEHNRWLPPTWCGIKYPNTVQSFHHSLPGLVSRGDPTRELDTLVTVRQHSPFTRCRPVAICV